MSNLLPREARDRLSRMYRTRFIVGGSLVALTAALIGAFALVPSYLALQSDQSALISPTPSAGSAADQADRAAIGQAQSLIAILAPIIHATTSPTEAIRAGLALRPSGISVDHITYAAGGQGTIVIVGSASGRGAVSAYRLALSGDPHFSAVTVPVGDLVGSPGGRFSVTLSGAF